jgi:hypothetical protein
MNRTFLLLLFCAGLHLAAQDTGRPYLIPPVVHVGDRATLVIPLSGEKAVNDSLVSLDTQHAPLSPDIDFHRIVLERRPSGSRLLVEFSAFIPGLLELPPIEIGGERFAGLRVEISSILESGETGAVLSGLAPALAIPGTSFLVYGTMGALVLILLLALWAGIWGRRRFSGWIVRWKRRRLIVFMWGMEKRLRRNLQKEGKPQNVLNILSGEFRVFLSFFTGENCRAMTAAELGRLPPELLSPGRGEDQKPDADSTVRPGPELETGGDFLGAFFRRCDEFRFSGSDISTAEALGMLDDLRRFLKNLDRAERNASRRQGEAA